MRLSGPGQRSGSLEHNLLSRSPLGPRPLGHGLVWNTSMREEPFRLFLWGTMRIPSTVQGLYVGRLIDCPRLRRLVTRSYLQYLVHLLTGQRDQANQFSILTFERLCLGYWLASSQVQVTLLCWPSLPTSATAIPEPCVSFLHEAPLPKHPDTGSSSASALRVRIVPAYRDCQPQLGRRVGLKRSGMGLGEACPERMMPRRNLQGKSGLYLRKLTLLPWSPRILDTTSKEG